MNEIKIKCKVKVKEDKFKQRLVFDDYYWEEWGETDFCVHGMKLRWSCDYCEEYFEEKDE